jgi:leucyl/phenylalanyl-tRNA--protein transferase
MPIYLLNDELWFPPVQEAMPDGLLAAGGDLSVERLLLAYSSGIFPWFNEEDPPLWWSPIPGLCSSPKN